MNVQKKKLIFALIGIFLMTSGIFTLVTYVPAGTIGVSQPSPALSNVGETAGTSIAVNYWTNGAVANSGTTTATLPDYANGTSTGVSFSTSTSGWTVSSGTVTGSYTLSGRYYYMQGSQIGAMGLILPLGGYEQLNGQGVDTYYYSVGTVTISTTVDGVQESWAYSFNSAGATANNAAAGYIEVYPTFSYAGVIFYGDYPTVFSVTITSASSATISELLYSTTSSSSPSNFYTYSGTSNSITTDDSSQPSEAAQPAMIGFYFTAASTSFAIPQYESSFDLTWSSVSASNPQYNGQSPSSTSGVLTGSLTSNSFIINPISDPLDINTGTGQSTYTFSYYLSSQNQVSTASATQNSNPEPTYTYTQVSGTTNQASASFSFSGTVPSGAVFIPYETTTNSLTTTATNIVFTPSVTIQNPYYTFDQNYLSASFSSSSASAGSLTTDNSGVASPSFTGNSATFTTASSPSWTVNLNLYGNRHPVYQNSAISLTNINPLTPVSLYANYSETNFTGESQTLQSSWNGHALTSSHLRRTHWISPHISIPQDQRP